MEWWRRRRPASAYGIIVRGATSMALLVEGLWIAGDPALWPTSTSSGLLAGMLWLVSVSWAVALVVHLAGSRSGRRATRLLNAGALVLATLVALVLAASDVGADPTSSAAARDLALLTSAVVGLMLTFRISLVVVLGIAAVSLASVLRVGMEASGGTGLQRIAFAVVVGLACAFARRSLTEEVQRNEQLAAAAAHTKAERVAAEGVADSLQRAERTVHATVLNTLTAVERGGLGEGWATRLRERCRESADVLRDLWQGQLHQMFWPASVGDALQGIDGEVEELRASGVVVEVLGASPRKWDPMRQEALVAAVREALSNVGRHARAHRVTITLEVPHGPGSVRVLVRDDGRGFDPAAASPRYGLAQGITEPVERSGGRVTIDSAVGRGTVVTLEWPPTATNRAELALAPSAAGFTIPVLVLFGVYASGIWLTTLAAVPRPWVNALAFGLLAALYVLLIRFSGQRVLSTWIVLVALVAAPLAYWLHHRALASPGAQPEADWATFAVDAVFIVLAAAGPRWAWAAAWVTWVAIQGDVLAELASPGSAAILGAAVYGLSARRNAATYEAALERSATEDAALASARSAVAELRRRYAALDFSRAVDLLDGLADGRLEADDPEVRHRAVVEERFIRNVLRVDPRHGDVSRLAIDLAVRAHARGVLLTLDLGGADDEITIPADARQALLEAMDSAREGTDARVFVDRAGPTLRLLVSVPATSRVGLLSPGLTGQPADPQDALDDTMVWEARLSSREVT